MSVVEGDPVIQKGRLERVSAKYLETECESLLKKYLPGAQVFRNSFWSDATGKRFETDVLALIENRLLVFEAKGSILPDRVRLGNFAKAKSFLKDTYGLAGIQASRLEEEIRKRPGGVDFFDSSGRKLLTLSSERDEDSLLIRLPSTRWGLLPTHAASLKRSGLSTPPRSRFPQSWHRSSREFWRFCRTKSIVFTTLSVGIGFILLSTLSETNSTSLLRMSCKGSEYYL